MADKRSGNILTDIIQKSDCKVTVCLKSDYNNKEIKTFDFHFDEMNYYLFLFGKILFKLPFDFGKWLFERGYAIEDYVNVRVVD
jgi:hypothetical protein